VELKLAHHFAFPLKKLNTLTEFDPIAYITGNMTKLAEDETVVFQVIAAPVEPSSLRDIQEIRSVMYKNQDLVQHLKTKTVTVLPVWILSQLFRLVVHLLLLPIGILVCVSTNGREGPFLNVFPPPPVPKTKNLYQTNWKRRSKRRWIKNCSRSRCGLR